MKPSCEAQLDHVVGLAGGGHRSESDREGKEEETGKEETDKKYGRRRTTSVGGRSGHASSRGGDVAIITLCWLGDKRKVPDERGMTREGRSSLRGQRCRTHSNAVVITRVNLAIYAKKPREIFKFGSRKGSQSQATGASSQNISRNGKAISPRERRLRKGES